MTWFGGKSGDGPPAWVLVAGFVGAAALGGAFAVLAVLALFGLPYI